ncbi:MAG: hypothetical protein HUU16_14815, partial [Candidatus Omnitrophica bacterium]|nr:hypothetical protein [Candidatus Omnitrophota bacterium]
MPISRWIACALILSALPAECETVAEGRFGRALDARKGAVQTEGREVFSAPPFTVECWARLFSKIGFNILAAHSPKSSADHWELYSYAGTGFLSAYLPGFVPSEVQSSIEITDGQWHLAALSFDGETVRLFLDGAEVAARKVAPNPSLRPGKGVLSVGAAFDGVTQIGCDGLVDEVRVSKGTRMPAPLPDGPPTPDDRTLGLWRFEESSGSEYADLSAARAPLRPSAPKQKKKTSVLGKEIVTIDDQDEADWADDRWPRMKNGPFFSGTIAIPGVEGLPPTYKGIAVRVGPNQEAAVLYDIELLRMSAAWTGEFLKIDPKRLGIIVLPQVGGDLRLYTKPAPGWANGQGFSDPRPTPYGPLPANQARYEGLYESGERVVLAYSVGSTRILESPWLEGDSDVSIFSRTLEIAPATEEFHLLLCDVPGAGSPVATIDGVHTLSLEREGETTAAGLVQDQGPWCSLAHAPGGHIRMIVPRHPDTLRVKVLLWQGPSEGLQSFYNQVRAQPLESLASYTQGGSAKWTEAIVSRGIVNKSDDPYVIDTLPLPFENPYGALFYVSGHDFLPDGDLALCTVHGDVWRVSGIDADLDKIRWKRIATGLFQPLGLKVVAGVIHVLGRDQITRLYDRDQNGETDYYENFCNLCEVADGGHSYATCLETDSKGNLYFLKGQDRVRTRHDGCLLRVSPDGRILEVVATGFRFPNGLGLGPGDFLTTADQEGEWVPGTRIDKIREGGFYGVMTTHHRETPPETYEEPILWLPQDMDNSAGGQVWAGPAWGPLAGKMIHLSYGLCMALPVLPDENGGPQAAAFPLPLQFLSGVMRGRVSPTDGQVYLSGLRGWQTNAVRDGCLQRIRYTGGKAYVPVGFAVLQNGVRLRFSCELDPDTAADPENFSAEVWNYRWSGAYGSED